MPVDASDKENCVDTSWITPVALEDGWLDKMDSSLTSVHEELFPDLSWSDSSEAFFHPTTPETIGYVDETPPAKKNSSPPKPQPKKAKAEASRFLLDSANKTHTGNPIDHVADMSFLDKMPSLPDDDTTPAIVSSPFMTLRGEKSTKRSWGGWSWDDQCVFFQAMKRSWTSASVLPRRWEQLTRKLPHKSVSAIQHFYSAMVSHVHDMLLLVHEPLNVESPEEIRFALSCWHRVCSSELDISNPLHKKRLAGRLKNTLLKSRKSSEAAISAQQMKRGLPPPQPPAITVHTPIVRKKRPLQSPEAPQRTSMTPLDDAKRFKVSPGDAKKKQIKVRFVPIDKTTQSLVARIGARPKVELKMNGSKRISDVCSHMMTKWAAVQQLVGPDALFRVVPLGDRLHPGWSADDISVTCWDIFHQYSRPLIDDDIVTLEYRWTASSTSPQHPTTTPPQHEPQAPTPATTYITLDFLPPPDEDLHWTPSLPLPPTETSTDFNGFLDEGPGACTAWMESLLPHSSSLLDTVPTEPAKVHPVRQKKRITPTLISK
ncbi:hypothetical protein LEN26_008656 [Aphanomyces euteiches]|nr:hypothetical protein LEN26_008656 [Aphanomyces euteiches]